MKRSKTDMLVWHCSATEEGVEVSRDTITKWHKARGMRDIGYNLIVHLDGSVEIGRGINEQGAHAKGYNSHSIGACYIGGLRNGKPADTRTEAQKVAMRAITILLKEIYPITDVVGHRDLSVDLNEDGVITQNEWMKSCPCFDVKTEL